MSDQELRCWLEQAVNGDRLAFEKIYLYTRDDVYRTVSFLMGDPHDVNDIVNEVYIQLWKSLTKYDPSRPFRYWLHGLVVRQVQGWRRKIWRRLRLINRQKEMSTGEAFLQTDYHTLQKETRDEIVSEVQKLSYKLRAVITLRYFHDYTLEEIATLLEIPIGTVKSRHNLAIKELRKKCGNLQEGKVSLLDAH